MLSDDEVKKIAKLAHLTLDDSEIKKFSRELSSILDYIQELQKIDVSAVEPTSHVHGSTNIFREDVVKPSLDGEEGLKNAPDRSGRFIRVPIIVEQGVEN